MGDYSFDKKMVKRYFAFINERHKIYLNRANGQPFPWTKDPILQQYSFTNVFRELDKVTVWIRKNWREPHMKDPDLWFAMCVARQLNRIETLEEIGYPLPWDPKRIKKILDRRMVRGDRVFTSAYLITGTLGGTKIDQVVFKVLDRLATDPPPFKKGMLLEEAWSLLNGRTGFGEFLAYEVVTDLRHTPLLKNAKDIMLWANPGPGAMRGINRICLLPHKPRRQLKYGQYIEAMRELLLLSPKFRDEHVPPLEMRDIEHCLCEFDKYERARLGQGRPKAKFIPPEKRK